MRNFKKVIAGALALLMLALSVNVSFAAEEYSDAEAVAVAKVNAAGIMQGTDKGFEPTKTLTRAEAAAIMVRMKGISEETVKQSAGTTLFTDVAASHWAAGYINVASNYGIIVGVGANKFAPEKEVTVAEYYTMAVRALGAGKLVDSEGVWPTNYVNFAIENDLAENVSQVHTATATRMTAAIVAANTLEADLWEKDQVKSNGEITWSAKEGKTILKEILKIDWLDGVTIDSIDMVDKKVTFKSYVNNEGTLTVTGSTAANINNFKATSTANLAEVKVGDEVDVWFKVKTKEIIMITPAEESRQERVNFTAITKALTDAKHEVEVKVDGEKKLYEISYNTTSTKYDAVVYDNGVKKDPADVDTLAELAAILSKDEEKFGTFTLVDGIVKSIYVEKYNRMGVVKEVTDKKVKYDSDYKYQLQAEDITIDSKKAYTVTRDGKAIDVKDLEEGDVYYFYAPSAKEYVICAYSNKTVDGTVKMVGTNEIKIGSDKYTYLGTNINVNDNIIAYLDRVDKVMAWKKVKGAASDVAVISKIKTFTDKYDSEGREIVLSLLDGSKTDTLELDIDATFDNIKDAYKDAFAEPQAADKVINGITITAGTVTIDKNLDITDAAYDTAAERIAACKFKSKLMAIDDVIGLALLDKVCYSVNGSKVTLDLKLNDEFTSFSNATLVTTTKVANLSGVSVPQVDKTKPAYTKVYVTEGTKIYVAKAAKYDSEDATKVKELKLVEVSLEDLKDKSTGLKGFVAGMTDNEVGYLVIEEVEYNAGKLVDSTTGKLGREVTSEIFGAIVAKNKVSYNDDNKDDYALQVMFSDGTDKEVYWVDGDSECKLADLVALNASDASTHKLYRFTLDGEVVVDFELVSTVAKVTPAQDYFKNIDVKNADADGIAFDEIIVCEKSVDGFGKASYEALSIEDVEDYSSIDSGDLYDSIVLLLSADVDTDATTDATLAFVMIQSIEKN